MITGCRTDEIIITDDEIPSGGGSSSTLVDPELAWSESTCEAVLGTDNTFPTLSNEHRVSVSYSSSEPSVATVDEDGAVTLISAGTTIIVATSWETEVYSECSVYYTLTVVRSGNGLAWSADEASVTIGGEYSLPTLSNPNNLDITYSSSDEGVATIDASGTVTIVAGGTAVISATSAETNVYEAGTVSYTLTVGKSSEGISWSAATCSVTMGSSSNSYPTLVNPAGRAVTYSSSDTSVATIDSNGSVTLAGAGSTIIGASSDETGMYLASSAYYVLVVTRSANGLAWSASEASVTIGGNNSFPTLSNPHKLDVSYSSSNTSVATISKTGTVTILAGGTTVISAISAGNDVYEAGAVSYTLTVGKSSESISWSAETCTAVIGSSFNTYPTLTNPGRQTISYSSSNTDVATISSSGVVTLVASGVATITAVAAENSTCLSSSAFYTLTVTQMSAGIGWSASTCSVTYGSSSNSYPTLSNPHKLSVSYASEDESVATVSNSGTVSLVGAGTTSIKAIFAGNVQYEACTVYFTLNVSRNPGGITWSEESCSVTIGASGNTYPTLTNPGGQEITYSSSNISVAKVSSSGAVTLVGAGTTTITATAVQNSRYASSSASYTLTVQEAGSNLVSPELSWPKSSYTITLGDSFTSPALSNPHGVSVTYVSSDTGVATVGSTGSVSVVGAGTATITANSSETDTYLAGSASYTLTVNKASAGISWSASSCTATLGGSNTFPTLNNPRNLTVSYSSEDSSVAAISSSGAVTLAGAGTAIIKAIFAGNSNYEASTVYYTLTVKKKSSAISWSASSCSATMGSSNTYPTLSNPGGQSVTYSSGNTSVAAISSSGAVTLVGAGTTTITAIAAESSTILAGSASYTLTVSPATAGLSWSASSCTATLGGSNTFPTLTNPNKLKVSYASEDESVATISSSGTVTLVGAGSTIMKAIFAGSTTYAASTVYYTLTVKKNPDGISWSASTCSVTIGASDNTYPTLDNPGGQSITYSSGNTSVVTISKSGTITLVGAGTATITATAAESSTYEAGSASYVLTVNHASAGISWSATSCEATYGESNSYPTLSNPNNLSVTYASGNESVATISSSGEIALVAAGTTTIKAIFAGSDAYAASTVSYTLTVSKGTPTLSWSSSSCTATLDESNTFPTLAITPSGLSVTYSSSNTSVATVNTATGSVSLVSSGTTAITATFAGDSQYKSASASYTLTVNSAADDGAVTTVFSSAGSSDDDDISLTTFTRLVTVTYSGTSATVSGYSAVSDVMAVSVSGAGVSITYTGSENVAYKLTGTASNGYFKLYSSKKQAIWLSGVSITNPSGAAINNQSGKRTYVYVDGTNTLADGSSAAYSTTGDEDCKGVFFSEGQLIFSGSSSGTNKLTVTANNAQGKSGIVSDDYVRMLRNASVSVTAGSGAGHGIKANEYVQLSEGTLNITTKADMKKGIASDDYVLVEGGTTTITVSGGTAYDSDDAEYKGSAGIKADNYFAMTGGSVTITNSGKGGKGVRAGSYDFDSSTHAVDASYITGGTLSITTTGSDGGSSSDSVSAKGLKIGWATKSGSGEHSSVTAYSGKLNISGGNVTVSSRNAEAIESKGELTISGGYVSGYSESDDGINCAVDMTISGGYSCAISTGTSSGADGFDANGNLYVKGGVAYGACHGSPDVAFDANTESSKKLYVQGGTVIAVSGIESGASITGTAYKASSVSKNTWYGLWNSSNSAVIAFKTPSVGSSMVVYSNGGSCTLKSGVSSSGTSIFGGYGYIPGTISGGSSVSVSSYSGGSGGGSGGGGR